MFYLNVKKRRVDAVCFMMFFQNHIQHIEHKLLANEREPNQASEPNEFMDLMNEKK